MSEPVSPEVVLVSDDLMVIAHVRNLAEQHGGKVCVVPPSGVSDAPQAVSNAAAVVVDLGTRGLTPDILRTLAQAAGANAVTVAFGPHVHARMLQAAQAAGFRHVVPRGRFMAATAALLGDLASPRGT